MALITKKAWSWESDRPASRQKGAGVVAPVALRDLAGLADVDRHPYRAIAAGCVHRGSGSPAPTRCRP